MAWAARKIINDTENLGYCLMTATPDSWHSHSSQKFCHGWQLEQDMVTLSKLSEHSLFSLSKHGSKACGNDKSSPLMSARESHSQQLCSQFKWLRQVIATCECALNVGTRCRAETSTSFFLVPQNFSHLQISHLQKSVSMPQKFVFLQIIPVPTYNTVTVNLQQPKWLFLQHSNS